MRWFDDGIWRHADGAVAGRFLSAVDPDELLSDAPSEIWPALMPCDFLPLVSNAMGDWLCVRLTEDNRSGEVVYWYHGGGDWIPWGRTLAEAVLFDSVRLRLPGASREHAVAPDHERDFRSAEPAAVRNWMLQHLGKDQAASLDDLSGKKLADAMLEHRFSEPAVLCGLVIDALHNPALEAQMHALAINDSDQVQQALFDNRLIGRSVLALDESGIVEMDGILEQQDWDAAAEFCRRCTEVAPELAWGWDLLGYAYERAGAKDAAIECYRKGLNCSVFTDQTVRVRTHGFNGDAQKFAAARLFRLEYQSSEAVEREYLNCLAERSPEERRDRVREFFSSRARAAESPDAHRLWVRAGWDLGAEPMLAFAELLEQIAETACDAGREAQCEIAKTHRECFRDRYRI